MRTASFLSPCRHSRTTSMAANSIKLLTGNSHPQLARLVADRLGIELTKLLRSASPTESAVGLAAVNALLGHPQGRVTAEKAVDILLERGRGKRVRWWGGFRSPNRCEPAATSCGCSNAGTGCGPAR